MIHEHDARRRTRLSWLQLLSGTFALGPVVAAAHSYAGHEATEVQIVTWATHAVVLGIVWGPLSIVVGAALLLVRRATDAAIALSICGAVQSAVWYSIVVFIFTSRFPPIWWLQTWAQASTVLSFIALWSAITQVLLARKGVR